MATPPSIDVDGLLAPIPGDLPAGPPVSFTLRQKLEEARKEVRLEDFAPDDPMRPDSPKVADWHGILRLTEETLTDSSKDLLVGARLMEALVKEYGFAGLRDGLRLLRRLVEECWDRLNPSIEDGDLEVRAAPFVWLDDPVKGARFPTTVRSAPLVGDEDRAYSWLDWRRGQDTGDEEAHKAFDRAVLAVPRQRCQDQVDDMAAAAEELGGLGRALDARLGELAPGLIEVSNALADCRTLADSILARKGQPPPPVAEEPADDAEATPGDNGRPASKSMTTREEVYEQLAAAATVLSQIEPHSPIPYMIQRAVELGRLPFPQLIKVLVRDQGIITQLNRELGIRDEGGE